MIRAPVLLLAEHELAIEEGRDDDVIPLELGQIFSVEGEGTSS